MSLPTTFGFDFPLTSTWTQPQLLISPAQAVSASAVDAQFALWYLNFTVYPESVVIAGQLALTYTPSWLLDLYRKVDVDWKALGAENSNLCKDFNFGAREYIKKILAKL